MKIAYQGKEFLRSPEGELVGVGLGFDFTAEHEWGIDEIKASLGIKGTPTSSRDAAGLKPRTATVVPRNLIWLDLKAPDGKGPMAALGLVPQGRFKDDVFREEDAVRTVHADGYNLSRYEILSAWDSRHFLCLAHGEKGVADLKTMHEAFVARDIVIGFRSETVPWLSAAGLAFLIRSRVPQAAVDEITAEDQDRIRLFSTVEKSGIEKRLKKAGKDIIGLSPEWADKAKTSVVVYLSSRDRSVEDGYYTLEQLDRWIKGGKLGKDEEQRPAARL
jgi:hypothetical protein